MIVYRHRRNDTGTVFYIGVGSRQDRSTSKQGRNTHWHNIVNKAGYTVEVLGYNYTPEEAYELEIFLIAEYGRVSNRTGILCNQSSGGESGPRGAKFSKESRARMSAAAHRKPLNTGGRDKKIGVSHFKINKAVDQYTKDGTFIKSFISITEAAYETKTSPSGIGSTANNKRKSAGGFIWKFKQTKTD